MTRIFTLGPPEYFGHLSWTRDRREAKQRWAEFWTKHVANVRDFALMDAAGFRRRYREILGSRAAQSIGKSPDISRESKTLDEVSKTLDKEIGTERPVNIKQFMAPGGPYDRLRGVDLNSLEGFEDDGVGYKDVPDDHLNDYLPPLPEVRRF